MLKNKKMFAIINFFNFFDRLKHQIIFHIKQKYYNLNPYLDHFNILINYNIIPYGSLEDFKTGKYDRFLLLKMSALVGILLVNIFRFLTIIFFEKSLIVQQYFFIIFEHQSHFKYFYITIILFFSTPIILCKSLLTVLEI